MNKKISIGIAVSLIIIAITITFTVTMIFAMNKFDSKVSSAQERASMYDKLSEIDKIARANFYGEIDDTALYDAVAQGYISGLGDPDSAYLTAEQIAARNAEMDGTAVSTGLTVEKNANGYAVVNNVVAESNADKMEVKVGDVITKIDGKDVLSLGFDAAQAAINGGTEGSKVQLVYNRGGEENTVELTRATVESITVTSSKIGDVYFIRIEKITNSTLSQFKKAVAAAQADTGVVGMVFDVRDTSGGYDIKIIADMLDALLPAGDLISADYAGGQNKVLYTSDAGAVTMPMAVIVNGGTSGFAELFAAVLGDTDSCKIVGTKTAGKGTLQELMKLTDGSGALLTVATLKTPSGATFNGEGVAIDYNVTVADDFIHTSAPDEMTDPQFKRAVEAIHTK